MASAAFLQPTIRTLLQLELLHTLLVRRDGGALDTNTVLLDGLSGLDRDAIIGLVAVLEPQVVVLEVNVQVRVDELRLDIVPDDAGHFVAIELDDGVLDFDLVDSRHGTHETGGSQYRLLLYGGSAQ